ncbi:hypothetical protein [Myxacorys almedinensis]|uniref:Uncharacterized protein n=1 Tax=Myxacorys almedinensis A TaxID=2690445 RepID=A0A8J7Z568_9CYAN|nr:hypothetical protein [Myxacorys almedinensis]NDJ16633.1 hypothetical protein [Myxacorys almedinensis A]
MKALEYIWAENLFFFAIATAFLAVLGWLWRHTKSFDIPLPLPIWLKFWFFTVQVFGVLVPIGVAIWLRLSSADTLPFAILLSYLLMLALQITTEVVLLRQFHSVAWIAIPYLYLPYRVWQLYQGIVMTTAVGQVGWFQALLVLEIGLWIVNYSFNLIQLPGLLRWDQPVIGEEEGKLGSTLQN